MHPFIIGVTSFGKSCGTETPGVYVRLSEYTDWIQNISGVSLDSRDCISRYSTYRESDPGIFSKDENIEHLNIEPYPLDYVARIGWLQRKRRYKYHCDGTFIHHQYVLTSASCLAARGIEPAKIKTGFSETKQVFDIEKVTVHPKFIVGELDNDIALIRLVQEVR